MIRRPPRSTLFSLHDALPISFFMFTTFTDRDGKYQLLAFAESGFDPLSRDRKSTRLNSSHSQISYAVFCLKKKTRNPTYAISIQSRPDNIAHLTKQASISVTA